MNIPKHVWRTTVLDNVDDTIAATALAIETIESEASRATSLVAAGVMLPIVLFGFGPWQLLMGILAGCLVYHIKTRAMDVKWKVAKQLDSLLTALVAVKRDVRGEVYTSGGVTPDQVWMQYAENAPDAPTSEASGSVKLPLGSQSAAATYALASKLARLTDLCMSQTTPGIPAYLLTMSNYTRYMAPLMNPQLAPRFA